MTSQLIDDRQAREELAKSTAIVGSCESRRQALLPTPFARVAIVLSIFSLLLAALIVSNLVSPLFKVIVAKVPESIEARPDSAPIRFH